LFGTVTEAPSVSPIEGFIPVQLCADAL